MSEAGMNREDWENKMCELFHKLMKGSSMKYDPRHLGIKIKYRTDPTEHAEWETIAVHKEFDEEKKSFLNVGAPPEDPAGRRRWEAEVRERRKKWEERIRSKTGKKCPTCGGWNTIRMTPEDLPQSSIITPISTSRDFLVCVDCSTRVMWDSQELECTHDTEIIFLAHILSRAFMYEGKMMHLRHPTVYVVKVNGQHDAWDQDEVRKMMYTMFVEEIVPLWVTEAQGSFEMKMRELQSNQH